jgi:hypothetical protein
MRVHLSLAEVHRRSNTHHTRTHTHHSITHIYIKYMLIIQFTLTAMFPSTPPWDTSAATTPAWHLSAARASAVEPCMHVHTYMSSHTDAAHRTTVNDCGTIPKAAYRRYDRGDEGWWLSLYIHGSWKIEKDLFEKLLSIGNRFTVSTAHRAAFNLSPSRTL